MKNDRNLETTTLQAGRRRDRRDIDGVVCLAVHPSRPVSNRTGGRSGLISAAPVKPPSHAGEPGIVFDLIAEQGRTLDRVPNIPTREVADADMP